MPPRQAYKKNVFINYIQDYPIEQRFRCVDRAGWHGYCFATPNKTYGNSEDEELLFHTDSKSPYTVSGALKNGRNLADSLSLIHWLYWHSHVPFLASL